MKRIVTIQDISCVGKCSLTVALPIISAFGVECAILPTAVLSTHTMFKVFTFRDLSGEFAPIAAHWKRENLQFDAIYTGYLGSFELIGLVSDFIRDFRSADNLVFIDPVMADNGKFYPGFGPEYARAMAELCGGADVIVQNPYCCGIRTSTDRINPITSFDVFKQTAQKNERDERREISNEGHSDPIRIVSDWMDVGCRSGLSTTNCTMGVWMCSALPMTRSCRSSKCSTAARRPTQPSAMR